LLGAGARFPGRKEAGALPRWELLHCVVLKVVRMGAEQGRAQVRETRCNSPLGTILNTPRNMAIAQAGNRHTCTLAALNKICQNSPRHIFFQPHCCGIRGIDSGFTMYLSGRSDNCRRGFFVSTISFICGNHFRRDKRADVSLLTSAIAPRFAAVNKLRIFCSSSTWHPAHQ